MSFEHRPSTAAAASLECLRRYQRCWEDLVEQGMSRDQFHRMDEELLVLQRQMALFPWLADEFAELVMRHAQVLRSLTKPGEEDKRRAEVQALARKHRLSTEALWARLAQCAAPA